MIRISAGSSATAPTGHPAPGASQGTFANHKERLP